MSLETEIKKLTQALETFTNVFQEANKSVVVETSTLPDNLPHAKYEDTVVASNVVVSKEIVNNGQEAEETANKMLSTKPVETKVEEVKEKPKKTVKKEVSSEEKITLQTVKDLTKEKMAVGVERKKLKDIIISIKPDASLPDLNEEELSKAYELMKDLK